MSSDPSAPRRPPHITVNSGSGGNVTDGLRSDSSTASTPGIMPGFSRSLTNRQSPYGVGAPGVAESSEMLLAPSSRMSRHRPYQDVPSSNPSRTPSAMSSRRTSWSSEAGSQGPFASPFDDANYSRGSSRAGDSEDDQGLNTQTVADKYNIMPSEGLLLFPEDIEKDDYLHNPGPDDDKEAGCDIWSKRGMMNVGGLGFITLGILTLFIAFPLLYAHRPSRSCLKLTSIELLTGGLCQLQTTQFANLIPIVYHPA